MEEKKLKRNEEAPLHMLNVGDRFYFKADAKKIVYEVLVKEKNTVHYARNKNAKSIRATENTASSTVVFLRNSNHI